MNEQDLVDKIKADPLPTGLQDKSIDSMFAYEFSNYAETREYDDADHHREDPRWDVPYFDGKVVFTHTVNWGNTDFRHVAYNPTPRDIMVIFNAALHHSGDFHHCFLEAIDVKEEDGYITADFSTGS